MEPNSHRIIPKKHVQNLHDLTKYECLICMEIKLDIRRCSGSCKSPICLSCASEMVLHKPTIQCPQRCSVPLLLQDIPHLELLFKCPFDETKCQQQISGSQEFAHHCRNCEYISSEVSEENLRKDEYVCLEGHRLSYANSSIQQFFDGKNFKCRSCGQNNICVSICKTCSKKETPVVYCCRCRKLPCTKESCPHGHELIREQNIKNSCICDICGYWTRLSSSHYYCDKECEFEVCEQCYNKLPEEHHLVPLEYLSLPSYIEVHNLEVQDQMNSSLSSMQNSSMQSIEPEDQPNEPEDQPNEPEDQPNEPSDQQDSFENQVQNDHNQMPEEDSEDNEVNYFNSQDENQNEEDYDYLNAPQ